jgi:hypothetical protein
MPKNLGILSSIDLRVSSHDLFNDIEAGYGTTRRAHHINVPPADLKNKKDDLINNKNCEVIATVGGLFVNKGIEGDANNVPFVSLVGMAPQLPFGSRCVGGIYFDDYPPTLNALRRQQLFNKGVTDRSLIGLYRYLYPGAQTDVSLAEEIEWNDSGTIFDSTEDFDDDLNGTAPLVPPAIQGLVISASPFFLTSFTTPATEYRMNDLVRAANKWLSKDQGRFIVYPLQTYGEANPSPRPAGRFILLGPDLHEACRMLGSAALAAQNGQNPGFSRAPFYTNP